MAIDTSFSIAFCVLFGQIVDYKDEHPNESLPGYAMIARDVLNAVDKVHADGSLKKIIAEDLDTYVLKDPAVVRGLKRYVSYGKKILSLRIRIFSTQNCYWIMPSTPFWKRVKVGTIFLNMLLHSQVSHGFFMIIPSF